MVEIYAKKYSGKIFGITREAEVSVVSQTVKTSTVRHPELVSGSLERTRSTSKRFRNKFGITHVNCHPELGSGSLKRTASTNKRFRNKFGMTQGGRTK